MTSLADYDISINVMAPAPVNTQPIGIYNTYEEAISIAIQSRKTHPKEAVEIHHINDQWHVFRDVVS